MFKTYFTDDLLQDITFETNRYPVEKSGASIGESFSITSNIFILCF